MAKLAWDFIDLQDLTEGLQTIILKPELTPSPKQRRFEGGVLE